MSKRALRMFASIARARRKAVKATTPASSSADRGRPPRCHWNLARMRAVRASGLAQVELEHGGVALADGDDLHAGQPRPAEDVLAHADAIAHELQHLAPAHALEELLRLDDGAGAYH